MCPSLCTVQFIFLRLKSGTNVMRTILIFRFSSVGPDMEGSVYQVVNKCLWSWAGAEPPKENTSHKSCGTFSFNVDIDITTSMAFLPPSLIPLQDTWSPYSPLHDLFWFHHGRRLFLCLYTHLFAICLVITIQFFTGTFIVWHRGTLFAWDPLQCGLSCWENVRHSESVQWIFVKHRTTLLQSCLQEQMSK